jgi:hypothetical protein
MVFSLVIDVVVRYKYFRIFVIHGVFFMGSARLKKKMQKKSESKMSRVPTSSIIASLDVSSEEIVRLKVTKRKGARIESVPLKKLERLATKTRRYWKFENGWLMLFGVS